MFELQNQHDQSSILVIHLQDVQNLFFPLTILFKDVYAEDLLSSWEYLSGEQPFDELLL